MWQINTSDQKQSKIDKLRQTSNISRTLEGNKIVDLSDVVGASPVGAAPTTSSFSTWYLASMDLAKKTARRYENHLSFLICCVLYYIFYGSIEDMKFQVLLVNG